MNNVYRAATLIYRALNKTTSNKNRRQKIAAIVRTLKKLSENLDEGEVYSREALPELPKLILTYTVITKYTDNDLRLIEDLSRYLNGEVGA